jgi:hypothetical protein
MPSGSVRHSLTAVMQGLRHAVMLAAPSYSVCRSVSVINFTKTGGLWKNNSAGLGYFGGLGFA